MRRDWIIPGGIVRIGLALALTVAAGVAASAMAWAPRPRTPGASRAPPPSDSSTLAQAIADDAPLPLILSATPEGPPAPAAEQTRIVEGPMEQVLYGGGGSASGGALAVGAPVVAQALDLFAHRLDLTRDLALGDRVRLVVRRGASPSIGLVLDYAELDGAGGAARFYRRGWTDGFAPDDFADDHGADLRRQLLRTPLSSRRVTSGFGPRRHPLLGYSRMHAGVDFAAAVGTPVLAAGDGVVEAAGWAGGYGRSIRLGHAGGVETLYAHLSAWAPLAAGARVRQGQVIGWTGASGLATGPHLHFEVRRAGTPIDPAVARLPEPPLDLAQRLAFEARKRAIDALLAEDAGPRRPG